MQMQNLGLFEITIIIFAIVFYLLPSLIAYFRKHKNLVAVFMLNLFLGWTLVGWVVSLVWAVWLK